MEYPKVPGYEDFNNKIQPPPFTATNPTAQTGENKIFTEVTNITAEDAKLALLRECSKHATWKKSAVEKMIINSINPSVTYYYLVESFCETRTTDYAVEPFIGDSGQPLSYPAMGPAPMPWEIQCFPARPFQNEVKLVEVPNTTSIQICDGCKGHKGRTCISCGGTGRDVCFFCKGTGSKTLAAPAHSHQPVHVSNSCAPNHPRVEGMDQCFHCRGIGSKPCSHCNSHGWKNCDSCCGSGQQRRFVRLTVNYTVEKSELLTDHGDIPAEKIKKAGALNLLDEQGVTIAPINNHSCPEINRASQQFILEHNAKGSTCRIHQQRHSLKAIRAATVTSSMPGSNNLNQFYVYGEEKNAYMKSFPSKCVLL